ncbi:related to FLR1-Putative H+ antiporter regulated by yAP-1 and involved in multidrug resistance [Rhynchosporium agropyri]|uniref:Related to FLR1-Putative H+ antiporter regulated by yAP-1 and involved in multidrug resistance n=1 Tax=Rhynchosporium agropyri TaxID=914238 RepID=A0A1E1KZW6_9HELO|nr:related to FLR1-Putative H+ antiporter regulated by yAP-1 and involved in multidrug resistance [Rhynchosporium agropyri]
MSDLLREAPLGQIIRWVSKGKYLQYPEEKAGFELPATYNALLNASEQTPTTHTRTMSRGTEDHVKRQQLKSTDSTDSETADTSELEKARTEKEDSSPYSPPEKDVEALSLSRTKSRLETIPYTEARLELEAQLSLARTETRPIVPLKTSDGHILVDWYTTDDPANPQNWSNGKRAFVSIVICLYTFVVYTGSAIYTSSEEGVIKKWGLRPVDAALPLSLYVLAYGVGPLLWAPLSEIPIIGRSPVYASTMALFTILSLPTAMVDNFAGLLVLRFLQGFFGSPCLANGAATMQDMYSLLYLPYALVAWVSAAYCGPALGPLLSGFAVTAKNWRWSLWEILMAAGPIFLVMFMLLPETSTPNILLRRAKRLRKLTGDNRLLSQSEIDQKEMTASKILVDAIVKPIEITLKDPAIAFVNVYTAIIYGIYYSFFEVFPLVYPVYYGFSLGMIGVVFTCILVACIIGIAIYCAYLYFYLIPDIQAHGLRAQESRLVPALFACFGPTIGLFVFGWTARESIHWIAPTIGITIYGASVFVVMQCIFVYVPLSYPQYAASLFAGNDFLRSAFACGSILFGRPLFINLGVGKGVSVLGGLSVIGIVGMFALWIFGAKLRARSKFAMS